MKLHALATMAFVLSACDRAPAGAVQDSTVCQDRVEAQLFDHRHELDFPENQGPEFYILDASQGGDLEIAFSFMRKNGWTAWASSKPEDRNKLYLIPNASSELTDIPTGKLEDGPRLVCRASAISGARFVSVTRRSKSLSNVVYEIQP